MSPRTKAQFEEIRRERRESILDAALELFARQGVSEVTMQDIAHKAEVSKGLIYNYFTNKEELLNELIQSFINHLYDYFDPDDDGILTAREMEYFVEHQAGSLKANVDYYKFLFMLLMQPSAKEMMEKMQLQVLSSRMWAMIATYFKKHNVPDPDTETWIFHTMLDGMAMNYVFNPETYPIDQIKELLIQKYCNPTYPEAKP